MNIVPYEERYHNQAVRLFDAFQDYLVALDPYHRLRRLPGYGEHILAADLALVAEKDGLFALALDGDRVLRFIVAIIERVSPEGLLSVVPTMPGRILELYVDEPYRGQGVATRLMQQAEKYLREQGCDALKVSVFAPNAPARHLYEKFGYEPREIDNFKKV